MFSARPLPDHPQVCVMRTAASLAGRPLMWAYFVRVDDCFIDSGNRPEYMIMTVLPVLPPDLPSEWKSKTWGVQCPPWFNPCMPPMKIASPWVKHLAKVASPLCHLPVSKVSYPACRRVSAQRTSSTS